MNKQFDTQALLQYALQHDLLDQKQYDASRSEITHQELVDMLQASGALEPSQIEKIQALFSLVPHWQEGTSRPLDTDTMRNMSFVDMKKQRMVCLRDTEGKTCVVTDQPQVDQEMLRATGAAVVSRAPQQVIDHYLAEYHRYYQETIIDEIQTITRRIRRVQDFGSKKFSNLFPQDYRQEIAEDVSTSKLLRRIVEIAEFDTSEQIVIQPRPDRLVVLTSRSGVTKEILNLPQDILASIYYKICYWADLPLEEPSEVTTAAVHANLSGIAYNCEVLFTPTTHGPSITVMPQHDRGRAVASMNQLGLVAAQQVELAQLIDRGWGMFVVSGYSQSGKTYGYYRMLEIIANSTRTISFEEQSEFVVESAEQTVLGARVMRDIQALAQAYGGFGLRGKSDHALASLALLGQRKLVLMETEKGVLSLVEHMIKGGIDTQTLKQDLVYNIVSYPLSRLQGPTQKRTLRSEEIAILQEHISLAELHELGQDIPGYRPENWSQMNWSEERDTHSKWWWPKKRHTRQNDLSDNNYYRGLCNISKVLEQSNSSNTSRSKIDHMILRAQKQSLLPSMLQDAMRGNLAISNVIAMLQKK